MHVEGQTLGKTSDTFMLTGNHLVLWRSYSKGQFDEDGRLLGASQGTNTSWDRIVVWRRIRKTAITTKVGFQECICSLQESGRHHIEPEEGIAKSRKARIGGE
jgi:hypothetical protein